MIDDEINEEWHTLLILPKKSGFYTIKYFRYDDTGGMLTGKYWYDIKLGWDVPYHYTISLWKEN